MAEPPDITPDTVVFFDANVLIPSYPRHLICNLHRERLLTARWSEDIITEVRAWLLNPDKHHGQPYSETQADEAAARLREDPSVLVENYNWRITGMKNDPDDWHVLAAAVHAESSILVTDNVRDFSSNGTNMRDVQVVKTDDFFVAHFVTMNEAVVRVLKEQTAGYRNPEMKVPELLQAFANANLPEFAATVRNYLQQHHPELLDG